MGAAPIGHRRQPGRARRAPRPSGSIEFAAGVREECELAGVQLVGGDTTSAPLIVITATVLADLAGCAPVHPLRRPPGPGARDGRTARLGRGRAGRAGPRLPLARGRSCSPTGCRSRPTAQGRVAAEAGATALIDVSDGLLADLGHVAGAPG